MELRPAVEMIFPSAIIGFGSWLILSKPASKEPLHYFASPRFLALDSLLQYGDFILSRTLSLPWDIVATPFGARRWNGLYLP